MAPARRATRKFEERKPALARVAVSGKNIEISAALKGAMAKRIRALAKRYFGPRLRAAVTVSREGPGYRAECVFRPVPGAMLHSRAEGAELRPTVELAVERAEKQLRRFKRRITNHHDSTKRPKRTRTEP